MQALNRNADGSGNNSPPSQLIENSFEAVGPNADISSVTNAIQALAAIRTQNTTASSGNNAMNQTNYKENMKMQRSQMSHFFKTKQPKISLYQDMERRMRESSEYTIGPEPISGDG